MKRWRGCRGSCGGRGFGSDGEGGGGVGSGVVG